MSTFKTRTFVKQSVMPASAEEVFAWHTRAGAFERLSPPWERAEVLHRKGEIDSGGLVTLSIPMGPLHVRWVAKHENFQPNRSFVDVQLKGPFRYWRHTHTVIPQSKTNCLLEDRIEYALPLGSLGTLLSGSMISRKLEKVFAYRHRVTKDDLRSHTSHSEQKTMKILVTGATGLVGKTLVSFLTTGGHEVYRLSRNQEKLKERDIFWDPAKGMIDSQKLEGFDAVVHLAGENIAARRWTAAQKEKIRASRVDGTRLLSDALARLKTPPQTFVCASAIGYYGNRGSEIMTENSTSGEGFLPEVCREWEESCQAAREAGIRVSNIRIGIVLSPEGGALGKMLLPFKLGIGGVLGSGTQYMSWVALDDVIGIIHHVLMTPNLSGPVNTVAPNPVTNREFTKRLGKVLNRPTILPAPAFAIRMLLGEMGDDLLLNGTRVVPEKLLQSGYEFRFSELETALRYLLGK